MWIECNPNPDNRKTTDCAVRALALALTIPWDDAYLMLVSKGLKIHDMPDRHPVVHAVLKDMGYKREAVPNTCPECYSIEDFCRDHPKGVFFVGFGDHIAVIRDGNLLDAWDSSHELPQLYWHKEGDE